MSTYWFTDEQLKKVIDRIEPQENGCWWYPAVPHSKGYASTRIGWPVVKGAKVHRLSWIYYKGDIPEGMVIDHLCHDPSECEGGNTCIHRRCVNPDHLQLISASDNNKKTVRVLKYRTHCKRGHMLENNVVEYDNKYGKKRICKTCQTENRNNYRAKARLAGVK
jgi:hypothetical protein